MLSKQNVSQASILLSFFAILGGLLGCVRESLVAGTFGPGAALDAYLAAFTIPTVFTNILNATLPFVFIQLFNRVQAQSGDQAAWNYAVRFLKKLIMVLVLMTAACGLLLSPLLRVTAMGFNPDQMAASRYYFNILAPSILLTGLFIYATAILQSYKHFLWPALTAVGFNFFIIGSVLVWGKSWGISSLAYGFLAGSVFQCAVLMVLLFRQRQPTSGPGRETAPAAGGLAAKDWYGFVLPIFFMFILDQGNLIVTRSLGSCLEKGSISVLYFANTILQLIQMVVTLPIVRALYPYLSVSAAAGDVGSIRERVMTTIKVYLLITIPATLGIAVLSEPLIKLLFQHGVFSAHFTHLTALVLLFYALTLVPIGLGNILMIVFFTFRKIWLTVAAALFELAINFLGGLLLMRPWGILGLSAAVLLASFLYLALMVYFFHTRIFQMAWKEIGTHLLKVLPLAGVMVLLTVLLETAWKNQAMVRMPMTVKLGTTVALSAAAYVGLGYWFRFDEIVVFIGKFRNAFKR